MSVLEKIDIKLYNYDNLIYIMIRNSKDNSQHSNKRRKSMISSVFKTIA